MTHTPTAPSVTPADTGAAEPPARFTATAQRLGELTDRKHVAYGRSLERVGPVLALLTADTPAERWRDPHFLADVQVVTRMLEKFCRVLGPEPLAFGEQPWDDAAGYALARATLCAEHAAQEAERQAAQDAVRAFTRRESVSGVAATDLRAGQPAALAPLRAEDTLRTLPGIQQMYQNAPQPASENAAPGDGFDRASPVPLPDLNAQAHAAHPGLDLNPTSTPDQGVPLHAVHESVLAGIAAVRGGPHADVLCAAPERLPFLEPGVRPGPERPEPTHSPEPLRSHVGPAAHDVLTRHVPDEARFPRLPFNFPVAQAAQALAALRPDLAPVPAPGEAD